MEASMQVDLLPSTFLEVSVHFTTNLAAFRTRFRAVLGPGPGQVSRIGAG